jgi:uncharacterized protein (DUF433 family)
MRTRNKAALNPAPDGFRYTFASMPKSSFNPWEIPNYTIEEAARYLLVPVSTVRYWAIGEASAAPLTTIFSRRPPLLSFKNLVELFVLESLRGLHDIGLPRIRRSVEELRIEKPSKYPLADHQLCTKGRKIYLEGDGDELVNLTVGGQHAFKQILNPFLRRVERNAEGIAERLFPFTSRQHQQNPEQAPLVVVIDPRIAFGMPVLVNSRISTAFLMSRRKGGTSISKLANDYGRSEVEIKEALSLEEAKAAA